MALPHPRIHAYGDLTPSHGTTVWTDADGVHGIAHFTGADLTFHGDGSQVRELIAHLVLLAAEMDAEAAGGDPDPEDAEPPPCPECAARQPFHEETCSWRRVSELNAAHLAALDPMETACDLIQDAGGAA
jgi:hypothetical protein